jgi:hypothetical protein
MEHREMLLRLTPAKRITALNRNIPLGIGVKPFVD